MALFSSLLQSITFGLVQNDPIKGRPLHHYNYVDFIDPFAQLEFMPKFYTVFLMHKSASVEAVLEASR